jgi:2-aminoethylphosphonate-pyruvate transaminase
VLASGPTGAGDEVWVEAEQGHITGMSKDRGQLGPVAGELVGISRISALLFARMLRLAEAAFERSLQVSYETDALVAGAREQPIACVLVPDLVWGEIDDAAHLARVRARVYPVVARLDAALAAGVARGPQ